MTILSPIRYLITLDLAQKGLSPLITSRVSALLKLIDDELIEVGYDFINPEIGAEIERLEDAIVGIEAEPFVKLEDLKDTLNIPIQKFEDADPHAFLDD